MGQALREIHQVYDDKLDGMRNELETYYNLKVLNLHSHRSGGDTSARRLLFSRKGLRVLLIGYKMRAE